MGTNKRVSIVFLTWDREEITEESVSHNLVNAGAKIDEIIWVDNGSTDGVRDYMMSINPDVAILNKENYGVPKGLNRGFVLSTGDYIGIIGVDRLMPDNWLKIWLEYMEKVGGVACIFYQPIEKFVSEEHRKRGEEKVINGLRVQPALSLGARIMSRGTLERVGYLNEGMGKYGLNDTEWGERAANRGIFTYMIPDIYAEHIGADVGTDTKQRKFKDEEMCRGGKRALMEQIQKEGYLHYTPYV